MNNMDQKFTQEELYILSDAIIMAINEQGELLKKVFALDYNTKDAIKAHIGKMVELNRKVCGMMENEREEEA